MGLLNESVLQQAKSPMRLDLHESRLLLVEHGIVGWMIGVVLRPLTFGLANFTRHGYCEQLLTDTSPTTRNNEELRKQNARK